MKVGLPPGLGETPYFLFPPHPPPTTKAALVIRSPLRSPLWQWRLPGQMQLGCGESRLRRFRIRPGYSTLAVLLNHSRSCRAPVFSKTIFAVAPGIFHKAPVQIFEIFWRQGGARVSNCERLVPDGPRRWTPFCLFWLAVWQVIPLGKGCRGPFVSIPRRMDCQETTSVSAFGGRVQSRRAWFRLVGAKCRRNKSRKPSRRLFPSPSASGPIVSKPGTSALVGLELSLSGHSYLLYSPTREAFETWASAFPFLKNITERRPKRRQNVGNELQRAFRIRGVGGRAVA